MNSYFKIMNWLYLSTGLFCAGLVVYFQIKKMQDEAIYALVACFVCGAMLGLRSWQRKRIEKLLREKEEKAKAEAAAKKKK